MSPPGKRCGRPPVLSCLEKKKRKQSLDRKRGKTRIYVGTHIDRWLTLKEKLDFRNDADVAGTTAATRCPRGLPGPARPGRGGSR
uniref:ZN692 protein n=1 Tax=Ornithorhynchus anatinus TaxID=9258 RepID=A0A6I8PJN3_ORNAN